MTMSTTAETVIDAFLAGDLDAEFPDRNGASKALGSFTYADLDHYKKLMEREVEREQRVAHFCDAVLHACDRRGLDDVDLSRLPAIERERLAGLEREILADIAAHGPLQGVHFGADGHLRIVVAGGDAA